MAGEKGRRLSAVLAIPGESPKQQKQDGNKPCRAAADCEANFISRHERENRTEDLQEPLYEADRVGLAHIHEKDG